MNQETYFQQINHLPEYISLPLQKQVRLLRILFNNYESILNSIIEDVSDRQFYFRAIHDRSEKITFEWLKKQEQNNARFAEAVVGEGFVDPRVRLYDLMVSFEQIALDIQEQINDHQLYIVGRFVPYRYETTLQDGSVILLLIDDWEEFKERHRIEPT